MVARLRVGEGFGVRGLQHRAGGTGILLGKLVSWKPRDLLP